MTFPTAIKKDSTTSIRKPKKTVRTIIEQDLSLYLNPSDYILWEVLENKRNVTSHRNIRSLKSAIVE